MLESLGAEHLAERTYGTLSEGGAQAGADRPFLDDRPRAAAARRARRRPRPRRPRGTGGAARPTWPPTPTPRRSCWSPTTSRRSRTASATACCCRRAQVVAPGLLTDVLTSENLSEGVRPVHRPRRHRRPLFRAAHQEPGSAQEACVSSDTDPAGSAARRDRDAGPGQPAEGIEVFLMRRHAAMDFVGRGDGVPRRRGRRPRPQRRHRLARTADRRGGPSGSGSTSTSPRRWSARRRGRRSRSPACCSPGPPTIRTASSATRRCTGEPARRWPNKTLSFGEFLRAREAGAARRPAAAVGELGDAQGGAHPPLRHLLLRRCAAGGPARRRRQHRDRPGRLGRRRRPRSTTSRAGAAFLLPPTWTQLDSLNGRTVAEVLAVERRIVAVEPHLSRDRRQLGDRVLRQRQRYNAARSARAATPVREFVSVHTARRASRHRAPCCCRARRPTR